MKSTIYYHFTGGTLRDGKPVPAVGKWLTFQGKPVPCQKGLHASPTAFQALQYAPGGKLHRVELGGEIVAHGEPINKYAAQKRRIVASIDTSPLCRSFARRVALDVIHLWDAPVVVRQYLETGEESLRSAAWDAARDAAGAAARAAAWDDAWDAARAAAWAAAWDAARAAAWDKYAGWFNEMVDAAFAEAERAQ